VLLACASTLGSVDPVGEGLGSDGAGWPGGYALSRPGSGLVEAQCGLEHFQVRQYLAWYRHVILAMTALAFLAATRARLPDADGPEGGRSDRPGRPGLAHCR
jgi:hypothetical protein